jgi:TonB-linked SusC/RagA family outer membrane protein
MTTNLNTMMRDFILRPNLLQNRFDKLFIKKIFIPILVLFLIFNEIGSLYAQQLTVKGTVTDDQNNLLSGVTVTEKNSTKKTITDAKGEFSIIIRAPNAVLVFSDIAFKTQEIVIKSQVNLKIRMVENINSLNEVVVIGYGEVQRKDLTGSVGTVNITELSKAPVVSFEQALAGRVAGVQVTSLDGQPGSASNIIIRGQSSITQDNSPLYVIDGFPIENPDNNSLNPADIESIQVLKDASSAAIYGSRGANGVVLITTKQGKLGAPVLNYDSYYGFQNVIQRVNSMNAYEFVKYQLEVDPVLAPAAYLSSTKTLEDYKKETSIDWEDQLYQSAPFQNYNLSLRGGTLQTKYSMSGSITANEGVIINSGINRQQGRLSIDQVISPKLKAGVNINYSSQKSYGTPVAVSSANSLMFNIWGRRPTNGKDNLSDLLENGEDLPTDTRWNPILSVNNELRDRINSDMQANTYIQYSFLNDFTFKATGVYRKSNMEYNIFNNSQTRSGSPLTSAGGNGVNGSITFNNLSYFTNENTLTYYKRFNKVHSLNALVGYTIQSNISKQYGAGAILIPNESLGLSGLDEGTPFSISSANSINKLQSYLSRFIYNYKSKYIITTTFRADGSSKFSGGNRWGYFPSAALAWNFSKEKLFKDFSLLSDGKLRLSYGAIGNNRVSDFAYLSTLNFPISNSYSFSDQILKGIVPGAIGNPNLKWETSKELNLAIDVSLLKNRISLTTEIYNKKTDDLLLLAQLPPSFGYSRAFRNIGSVQNRGLEFTLNTQNIEGKAFNWNSNFNISFNRNKVLSLTDNQEEYFTSVGFDVRYNGASPYITKIGQPIGVFYGFNWVGNYQYADFDEPTPGNYVLKSGVTTNGSSASQIKPGHIKYQDTDGNLVVNDLDRQVIGNPNPDFTGGLSNNFTYKNFELNVFMQFSYGNDIMNANRLIFEGLVGTTGLNMFASYANRWSPENQNNTYYTTAGGGPRVYSNRTIEDGSFLRLKTVSFSYNLPFKLLSKVKIKNVRLYTSAQNLYTWTKYSGSDPEVATFSSAIVQGFDFSAYPRPRTVVVGLNVTF